MNDATDLEFTGERFIPGTAGEIWYEHWHRYHFAANFVEGRRVLDIACGEGYGSALLAQRAAHVTGADIAAPALRQAWRKYATVANLDFRPADCAALPVPDASYDAVVSFETIEHIPDQATFLAEARRVLRPDGVLILSCPNKLEYSDKRGCSNPFHVRELYREELAALLARHFPRIEWYGQRTSFFSVLWPEQGYGPGEIFEVSEPSASVSAPGHQRPMYFVVVASCADQPRSSSVPELSILADREEWLYRDYEKVMRDLGLVVAKGEQLEGDVATWRQRHEAVVFQRDTAAREAARDAAALAEASAALTRATEANAVSAKAHAATAAALAAQTAALEATSMRLEALQSEHTALTRQTELLQCEISRRAGLRWWITLPFRKARLALKAGPPRP